MATEHERAIAWRRRDDWERGGRWSRSHLVDAEHHVGGRTLCGIVVPQEGDGVEVENGHAFGEGFCERCHRASR